MEPAAGESWSRSRARRPARSELILLAGEGHEKAEPTAGESQIARAAARARAQRVHPAGRRGARESGVEPTASESRRRSIAQLARSTFTVYLAGPKPGKRAPSSMGPPSWEQFT